MRLLVTVLLATASHGATLTITSICTSQGITVSSSSPCQLPPVYTSLYEDHRIGDGLDSNVLWVSLGASAEGLYSFGGSASIDADLSLKLVTDGPQRQGIAAVQAQGFVNLGLLHGQHSEYSGFDLTVNGRRPDQIGGYPGSRLPVNLIPVTLGTTEGIVVIAHVDTLYIGTLGTGADIYAELRLLEADGITPATFREADVPEPGSWCLLLAGVGTLATACLIKGRANPSS